jgi:hypothetical protein
MPLGDTLLLVARAGFRLPVDRERHIEGGLTVRAPLGSDFREYSGMPVPLSVSTAARYDFGGQVLVRLVSFYLRGSF